MKQALFLFLVAWLLSGCSSIVQNQLLHPAQFDIEVTGATSDELLEMHNLKRKEVVVDDVRIAYLWGERATLPESYKPPTLETKFNHTNASPGVNVVRNYKYEDEYWDGENSPAKGLVVLLHSYSTSSMSMLYDNTAFQMKGYNTIVLDLLGHGESDESSVSFGPQDIQRLHALIQHVQANSELPLILYGKSYGASIGAQYAEAYGEVDGLIAVAPMTHFTRAAMLMSQFNNPKTIWLLGDEWVEKEIENTLSMAGVSSDSIATPNVLSRIPSDSFPPTLIFSSESDKISNYDDVKPLAEYENVTLVDLPKRLHIEMMFFENIIDEHIYNWLNTFNP